MPRTFIVGLSGLSSTGKTTLSRYLRSVFPSVYIIYQDDYYRPDSLIPTSSQHGIQDWDCIDAFDFVKLAETLDYVQSHGNLPPSTKSITDDSLVGEQLVDERVVVEMRTQIEKVGILRDMKIVIIEGILLFQQGSTIESRLDVGIFLRAPYDQAKQRREARTGYITIEGFWADPPGYYDNVVWPNYVKEHKYLFVNDDIEGNLRSEVSSERRIHTPGCMAMSMPSILQWAVDVIIQGIQ